jgi:serine/threonine protein kinase
MPNGSLEKWLHPDGEEASGLSLIQRLNIAIDIAQGMAYLHHHCFVQVLHCDLKPSNVLLGKDMTAYLTDFGIATICSANFEDSMLTSTHALKGSAGYIPPGIVCTDNMLDNVMNFPFILNIVKQKLYDEDF